MAFDINKAKRALKKKIDEARAIHDLVVEEKRTMNEDEQRQYDEIMTDIDQRKAEIAREERLLAEELAGGSEETEKGPMDYRAFGDFLQAVKSNDSGLKTRALNMGVGAQGGFIVPEQFDSNIRMIDDQAAWLRPRAQVIPAGNPPDAAITVPALDQSGARGVYSGVNVTWIGEGDEKPETEPQFKEIKLEPQEVAAHVVVTDKLLRNSAAVGALVESLLRKAIIAAEQDSFWTGDGVGKPLGIIGHPSAITVNRTNANQIVYDDIVSMYSQAKFGGRLAWVTTQTALPQLMTLTDAANNLIWQPNARDGAPGTLIGLPVLLNDQSPILGAQGDLALVDLDYYLIKDGSGIAIAMSEHPRFTRNQTIIKAFWNVDGQPWLNTPLLQRDGVSQVSPFVVLD